jgi:predicted amidohydrolase YtcJ
VTRLTDHSDLLVVRAEVKGRPGLSIRIRRGLVAEVGPSLERCGERVLDAAGGAVIPGLNDHHVHLHSLAAALESVDCGPDAVGDERGLVRALKDAARKAPAGSWLRAVGYHESVAGRIDRDWLDLVVPHRPVRMQHRSGGLWMLNSLGVRATGLERASVTGKEIGPNGRATGRLFRQDRWLASRLARSRLPDLDAVGRLLSASGVTGVTEATPDLEPDAELHIQAARARGDLPQRVLVLGVPIGRPSVLPAGPSKLWVDEAAGLDLSALTLKVAAAHAAGRPVALHCVTRAEVVAAVGAIEAAGPVAGDRLEHASELPPELDGAIRAMGLTVVTQPNFIAERGDTYASESTPDLHILYRCGSLLRAGILVAGGTDAPLGRPDPWAAMQAAVERTSMAGLVIGQRECISTMRALGLFQGRLEQPGRPAAGLLPGQPADLCMLQAPIREARRHWSKSQVRATIIGGQVVYDRF